VFEAEAKWVVGALSDIDAGALSPLLNVGSSDRRFREDIQPWIQESLFGPLERRGVRVVHSDLKQLEGVEVAGDLMDEAVFERLKGFGFKSLLCNNVLEHVLDPKGFVRRCSALVADGGYMIVTVPNSYPHHRDPIDTMFRPTPEPASYRDDVRRRPWILLRHVFRAPFPFLGFTRWKRSMKKLYWLVYNYRVTCVVLKLSGTRP
jgi:hypothetical protein